MIETPRTMLYPRLQFCYANNCSIGPVESAKWVAAMFAACSIVSSGLAISDQRSAVS